MVPAAGGGGGDAFLSAVQGEAGLYGFWSAKDSAKGSLATGMTVMTDLSGGGHPDLNAVVAVDGNWVIDDSAPPSAVESLSKYAETTIAADTNNYAALASALPGFDPARYTSPGPAGAGQPNLLSGFVIYSTPDYTSNGQLQEIVTFGGTTGVPDVGSDHALSLFLHYSAWLPYNKSLGESDPALAGATPGLQERMNNWGSANFTDPAASDWWFVGYRGVNTGGESPPGTPHPKQIDEMTLYFQRIGAAWGSAGNYNTFTYSNYGIWLNSCWYLDGLRLGYRSESSAAAGARWAGVGMYVGDIGLAGLQNIYSAIP